LDDNRGEDIRQSSSLFNSYKIQDFVTLYFSYTAVGCSIIAYEFDEGEFRSGSSDEHVAKQVSTLLWVAIVSNMFAIVSIVMRNLIYF